MTATPSTPKWTKPPSQVNSVAISDDGTRCVYGSSYERGQGYFYTHAVDNKGNQLWQQPIIKDQATYQGVYWVDISGDGAYAVAGGETVDYHEDHNCATPGFLQAFVASTGEQFLNVTKPHRINQVSLSKDGKYLAVCYGKTVEVYMLNKTLITPGLYKYSYESIHTYTSETFSMNSCVMCHDGTALVAAGIHWHDGDQAKSQSRKITSNDTNTGKIFSFSVSGSTVSTLGTCPTTVGCMRVSISNDGHYWAGCLHDGSCVLINKDSANVELWSYKPTLTPPYKLSLSYAVDISKTSSGDVYVACGANLSEGTNGGLLYMVKNTKSDADVIPPVYMATPLWQNELDFGVNPGVSMDKDATYVTATDGKPVGQTTQESAGNLYLYEVSNGTNLIKQPTFMMNWPMQISQDASAIIGASDDGTVYFWQAPFTSS